jgi:hypothetical protein
MTKKSEKAREAEIADQPNRGALPIPHREHTGLITYDAKDPTPPSHRSSRCSPPKARPTS